MMGDIDGRAQARERYLKWWRGKLCKPVGSLQPFKRVVDVEVSGPPSFVYGFATLIFEDGTSANIYQGEAFRPRKCDVLVKDE